MDILLLYPMVSIFVWNYNHYKEVQAILFVQMCGYDSNQALHNSKYWNGSLHNNKMTQELLHNDIKDGDCYFLSVFMINL